MSMTNFLTYTFLKQPTKKSNVTFLPSRALEEKLERRNDRMRQLELSNKEYQERFVGTLGQIFVKSFKFLKFDTNN